MVEEIEAVKINEMQIRDFLELIRENTAIQEKKKVIQELMKKGAKFFFIIVKGTRIRVGGFAISPKEIKETKEHIRILPGEIGFFAIKKQFRGKPKLSLAALKLLESTAKSMGLKKIVAKVDPDNPNWRRFAGKGKSAKTVFGYSRLNFTRPSKNIHWTKKLK